MTKKNLFSGPPTQLLLAAGLSSAGLPIPGFVYYRGLDLIFLVDSELQKFDQRNAAEMQKF